MSPLLLKYLLSSTIHDLTDWLPTQTHRNPHEHWHPPKTVLNIYLFILFIYIYIGVFIYMCLFLFFKDLLLWLWFKHMVKNDRHQGQFCSIASVHAGSDMSKLVASWLNHGYFMLKCLTFNC